MLGNKPLHQFVNAVDRVIGDTREYGAQIRLRVDVVEFCGANEAVVETLLRGFSAEKLFDSVVAPFSQELEISPKQRFSSGRCDDNLV